MHPSGIHQGYNLGFDCYFTNEKLLDEETDFGEYHPWLSSGPTMEQLSN